MAAVRAAGRVPLAVALGVPIGVLVAAGFAQLGTVALAVPVGALALAALALHPRATLALLVSVVVVFEEDVETFMAFPQIYTALPGPLRLTDFLMLALACGVVLRLTRGGEPFRMPGLLLLPLLLLAAAIVMGAIVAFGGEVDPSALSGALRDLTSLAVLPFLVVNIVTTRQDLDAAIKVAFALVVFKTATGAIGYVLGVGRVVEGTVLTYYSPSANLLLLGFLLALLAARMSRVKIPAVVWCVAPFALAVLILSFRRNFWIALVVGVVVVVLVATGRNGRALLIPAGAVFVAALYVGLTTLATSESDSPVVERVQSLAPTQLQTNAYERYRIDEQRNVRAEIATSPLTGIGLAVPWRARYPLAITFPGARDYTHVVVLWYWLKLGLVGLLAYLCLIGAAVRSGLAVWRRAPDPVMRSVGLAAGVSFLALAVAETTGSFLGVGTRLTVLAAIGLGCLAAAWLQLPSKAATAPAG